MLQMMNPVTFYLSPLSKNWSKQMLVGGFQEEDGDGPAQYFKKRVVSSAVILKATFRQIYECISRYT